MTTPPVGETLRILIAGARRARSQTGLSQLDRTLAALTLVGVAVVVAWPRDHPIPPLAGKAGRLGQQIWEHRSWWTD